MVTCIIDGAKMTTRADAHRELAQALQLPEYYGANLDALWDVVSTCEAHLTLVNAAALLNALQKYGCRLLAVLYEAAESNPRFRFHTES